MTELENPSKAPENPSEPLEGPRALAKRLLPEGSTVDEVVAETNLSKPTVLGFLGAARKAEKKLEKRWWSLEKLGTIVYLALQASRTLQSSWRSFCKVFLVYGTAFQRSRHVWKDRNPLLRFLCIKRK